MCTLVLLLSETIGRIGEVHPDNYLLLAEIGYFIIFLLDPLDILFAIYYMDCWMDDNKSKSRMAFRYAFEIFAVGNAAIVLISTIFNLRWFFYFENGIYYRGTFFYYRAGLMLLFIALLSVYAIAFKDSIMSEYKKTLLFLPIFSLIGAILQIFLANLDTTYAGIALGCLILFFSYQSRDVNMDYLSGVLNRRGLDIRMEEMIKSAASSGRDFLAIMMDVDNFKEINDSLGHEAGDRAIKSIAETLVDIFGENTYIGRFGGDEFCVITRETDEDQVSKKIDDTHNAIYKIGKRYGWPEGVDVSCGFHKYSHDSGLSAKQFQNIIDRLMYLEKQEHHKYT
ncbi:MAG: GGDEF domain-containing protein [Pseudobutyrivibrio sp.]|nr:GGDEF domain-containing protein [Pseudobutyrivibrio sp.]